MTRRRVAVTGLGVVSPHGSDADSVFDAVSRGSSAVGLVKLASDTGNSITIPAAVVKVAPWRLLTKVPLPTCDRISLLALSAADAAIADAQMDLDGEQLHRVGVALGTALGGVTSQDLAYQDIFAKKKDRLSPFTLVKVMYNGPTAQIAMRYHLSGPSITYTTTCSSSGVAIGEAMRMIRHGYADIMIAGGAEALFSYVSLVAWQALHVLAPLPQDDASAACRPFSLDRNGTVLGEGAAFLVLEDLEHARERGARIYAELAGYGICNDSEHLTQPSLAGQTAAMRGALLDAAMNAEEIDYLNAHGTGTKLNDLTETNAVKTVFGGHAHDMAISSTKSVHGHLVGAASALELLIAVKSLDRQYVPPTANLVHPDPECDLNYMPISGMARPIRAVMSNSFAVGGTAVSLVARTFP